MNLIYKGLKITALLLLIVFTAKPAASQVYVADDGYVEFVSSAPLLEFKGTSNNLTGMIDLDENLVDFYIDLNTLDTGINLRNRHMRESYLETEKYPFAEFTGSMISEFDVENMNAQDVSVQGTFTIHGVEKDMEISGTLRKVNEGLQLDANWTVLLDDHDIRRPRVVFYELADEQIVNISILLKTD